MEKDRKNRKHTGGKSSYRTHTKAAAFLSFVMAMILGISSFATFTTQAMEETGTQEVQSQSQDGADGEAQAQSSGDSVDRISFGTAFGDGNDAAILSPG